MADKTPAPDDSRYDQRHVHQFFRTNVFFYGENWRALGWQSRETQEQRFAVLAEVGPLAQRRILDVGCGLGDLYGYLRGQDVSLRYTGYDLVPEMVARAHERYPETRFEVRDALQGLGDERFDYVLSSGAFNINFGNNMTAVQEVLPELFRCCDRGVAINFLSIAAPHQDNFLFYYQPQELYVFCKTFCQHVQLREDYLQNDFTLYLYPDEPRSEQ